MTTILTVILNTDSQSLELLELYLQEMSDIKMEILI